MVIKLAKIFYYYMEIKPFIYKNISNVFVSKWFTKHLLLPKVKKIFFILNLVFTFMY